MAARSDEKTQRNREIYLEIVAKGRSYRKVAAEHGISATRVQQIVEKEDRKEWGPDWKNSGLGKG